MKLAIATGAGGMAIVLGLALIPAVAGGNPALPGGTAGAICGSIAVGSALPDGSTLRADQTASAQTIYTIIQGSGITNAPQAAVDALTAAWTESRLTNLPSGDLDSLGYFQERPSQGWGSAAQILDPTYQTVAWLTHLIKISGWATIDPAAVAQTVEASAFPDRYKTWTATAQAQVAGLTGTSANCNNGTGTPTGGSIALPAGFTLPPGTPAPIQTAIAYALAQLGKPYSQTIDAGIGPDAYDCSGLLMQAYRAAGIAIPRTTYNQYQVGQVVVGAAHLLPGDLIFSQGADPGPGDAPGHVVMYIGSDLIVQAAYTGQPIQINPLVTVLNDIVTIRRIVA